MGTHLSSLKSNLQIKNMEVGTHCHFSECNRLDFLPIQCSACKNTFCSSHYQIDSHNCANADSFRASKNVQIPVCPICSRDVPFVNSARNPDEAISQHIDSGCQIRKKHKNPNRCKFKGCKKKELIPITCRDCQQNFCLQHKFGPDHNCAGRAEATRSARLARFNNQNSSSPKPKPKPTQEEIDRQLALQLQSEWDQNAIRQQQHQQAQAEKDKCTIS